LPKILVVDHHEKKRDWLTGILKSKGFSVISARDGESGFKLFVSEEPSACVLTMTLPRLSGSELCLKLKNTSLGRRVPIILTSSVFKNMSLDLIAKSRWKVDEFLEEPYTGEQLLKLLAEQLKTYARMSPPPEQEQPMSGIPRTGPVEEFDPFGYVEREKYDPLDAAMDAADIAAEGIEMVEANVAAERLARRKEAPAPGPSAPPPPQSPKSPVPIEPKTTGAPTPLPASIATVKEVSKLDELIVPLQGDLEESSFPELLAAIFFARLDGALTIDHDNLTKKIFFREGLPINAHGDLREETLGQILRTHGLIDDDVHHRTLQGMMTGNKLQGDILLDIGALTPSQLYKALKIQAREKLLSVFAWHEGKYRIEEKVLPPGDMTAFEMWTPTLILQGILRHYDAVGIRDIFNEMKDFVLTLKKDPPFSFRDLRFPEEVGGFIDLIDGKRTVAEVVRDSPHGDSTYQVFYALLVLEQFDKVDPGEMAEEEQEELPDPPVSLDRLTRASLPAETESRLRDGRIAAAADFSDEMFAADFAPPEEISGPPEDEPEFSPEELADAEDSEPSTEEFELQELFAKKDAGSGKWASKPEPSPGRVSFDLDAEEEADGEQELELVNLEKPAPDKPERIPHAGALAAELNKTLDSFLGGVDANAGSKKDFLEETVHISLDDDLMKVPGGTRGTGEIQAVQNNIAAELNEEEKAFVEEILAEYLSLPKSSHYQIFGVEQDTDLKIIRDAYTAKVKKYHPDRIQNNFPAEVVKKANEIMARATDAFRTLSDHKRRLEYNQKLAAGGEKKERSVQMILAAENEFNAGLSAVKQHAWVEAKRHFLKAIEMLPEEGEFHAYLGWAIYNMTDQPLGERTKDARSHMEKAIRLNPRSDKAYYFLGMLLKDNNMLDKAALMFAQAFRYSNKNIDAKNQLKAIQMLRGARKQAAPAKKHSAGDLLKKDISLESVKKAILKVFW
jgi:CheY-like chemotaxis protein/curved DNA-binding protein CbpA